MPEYECVPLSNMPYRLEHTMLWCIGYEVVRHLNSSIAPEIVYSADILNAWAEKNGYKKMKPKKKGGKK